MRKIEIKLQNEFDWTVLNPAVGVLGTDKITLVLEKEQDQIFKRLTLQGTLTFTDKEDNGLQIFSIVSALNLSIATERTRVLLRVTLDEVIWHGFFTPRICKWDYNRRTFTVNPKTDDVYEPFLNNKYEINLYDSTSFDVAYSFGGNPVRISRYAKLWRNALGDVIADNTWSDNFKIESFVTSFFDSDINPVTSAANVYKQMVLIQKTNATKILEPGIVEASLQMFSFSYAMGICRKVFNVWWDLEYVGVDSQGIALYNFVLEHKSYFETVGTVHDLTDTTGTTATDKFYYSEDNVPRRIGVKIDGEDGLELDFLNGLTGDEKDVSIENLVLRVWRWEINIETNEDGFFLHTYTEPPLEEWYQYNVQSIYMSVLMPLFWLHGREYYYGRINGTTNFKFESVIPSIMQDIQIKKCVAFETNDYCDTTLTSILGEYGKVIKAEYRMNGGTTLTLGYSKTADNLIIFNVSQRVSVSGATVGSGILGYMANFYPGDVVGVTMRVNILVSLIDNDTAAETTECIDTDFGSTTGGGLNNIITTYTGRSITRFTVFLDVPLGYQIVSNVPLEPAEVCT